MLFTNYCCVSCSFCSSTGSKILIRWSNKSVLVQMPTRASFAPVTGSPPTFRTLINLAAFTIGASSSMVKTFGVMQSATLCSPSDFISSSIFLWRKGESRANLKSLSVIMPSNLPFLTCVSAATEMCTWIVYDRESLHVIGSHWHQSIIQFCVGRDRDKLLAHHILDFHKRFWNSDFCLHVCVFK